MINNLTSSVQPSELYTFAQAIEFVFKKKFMDFYCLTIAKVLSVNDNKTLVIQPLINFKLADGTSQIPPQISNVPFGIIAGGNSAIIIPYAENDIVLVGFIDREFNALKQDNTTAITPELIRMHNIADAFVIMNWGNGKTPTTVIRMDDRNGINITSSNNINIQTNGGGIDITSSKDVNITSNGTGGVNIIAPKVTCATSQTGLTNATPVVLTANGATFSTVLYAEGS